MSVTNELVDAFLKCPTKCFLRSRGEVGTGNYYADWVRTRNELFRTQGVENLAANVTHGTCVSGTPVLGGVRSPQWQLATEFHARSQNLESFCHAVERHPAAGGGRAAEFVPIRFVAGNKIAREDKLLLSFDARVLSELLGRKIALGKIVHGDNYATLKVKTSDLAGVASKLTDKIRMLIENSSPPDLVLNRHCGECEFQTRCRQRAIEKDDLSRLAGMTEKERMGFNRKGIFTVTQLSYTFRPRRRPDRSKDKRERYHHSLKALAIRENKIHIVGTPEMKTEGTPVYLDVEGLPDRGFYYLIGVRTGVGQSVAHQSFWADRPSDEHGIWQAFLSMLIKVENPILVHYGSFESIFLRRMRERYGGLPNNIGVIKALESPINLVSVIFGQIYFPTYSNRLKEIAEWLGFRWSDDNASGLQSIVWRIEWETTRAPLVKEKLINYNTEDCAALELVAGTTAQICQREIGSDSITTNLEIVAADILDSKLTRWPKFSTTIQGFEAVNKAARWDYQRDRVYIRTDERLKQAKKMRERRLKGTIRVGKVVACEPSRVCPRCHKNATNWSRVVTKCLHDLRFTKCGVTGQLVKYQFRVFRCATCQAFTPWPKEFWERSQYGRNLAAFSVFEVIDLCVSLRSVTQTLNRIFGFRMNEYVVRRFKERAADYHRATRENILAGMVKGNLIHADETRIPLHGKVGYVWVFATFREVAYYYSATREGTLIQSALHEFKGVLVSDFYTVYDSIPCAQQKCLLHLMRDLNDAVLDNPYDEGAKTIATAFAELLRDIVQTTDRWGLKSRFLRKHLADVARFYKRISKTDRQSEAASKLKDRLEKDREKLFTFLSHDGIPWNNNNAEHAIKAFARLRRAIEGLSTPKGIEQYLILLSVCQTCKYSGLDFLDFLRSGETDIGTFAASRRTR